MRQLAADGAAAVFSYLQDEAAAKATLRRLGQPEDIPAVVAFLAGPDSGWISGQNLPADGGLLP